MELAKRSYILKHSLGRGNLAVDRVLASAEQGCYWGYRRRGFHEGFASPTESQRDVARRLLLSRPVTLDNVLVLSKRRYQCSEASCDFFADDGTLAIWDYSHWTLKGARTFMTRFTSDYPELFHQQNLN